MNKTWRAPKVPAFVMSTVMSAVMLIGLVSPVSSQASPALLNEITDSEQVVLVTASSWRATMGTVQVFEKRNKSWSATQNAVKANLDSKFSELKNIPSACGLRPKRGWTIDMFAYENDKCIKCVRANYIIIL